MASAGAPAGTTVTADVQHAGRGRMDRTWVAPPASSLLCSVLLRPSCGVEDLHLATLAMAVAALDAITASTGMSPALKWPNDLLFDGRKCGGILAEAQPSTDPSTMAVVVGIGINCTFAGPPEATGTSLLAATGVDVAPATLGSALLHALTPIVPLLDTESGRSILLERYRGLLDTLGREVRVEMTGGSVEGRAIGVDGRGALLVEHDGAIDAFHVGDVVHLRPR